LVSGIPNFLDHADLRRRGHQEHRPPPSASRPQTAFVTGSLAMAIAPSRSAPAGRYFSFLSVHRRLSGRWRIVLDSIPDIFQVPAGWLQQNVAAHTSWFTGLEFRSSALRVIFNEPTYARPLPDDPITQGHGWPVNWYLSNPAGFTSASCSSSAS